MDDRKRTGARLTHGDAMQRASRAWHLRVLGVPWKAIAQEVGFANDANAIRAVRRFVGALPEPQPGELRMMWRARMEHLWAQSVRDVAEKKPGSVRAAVAVAQRASQLDGLDAPTKVELHNAGDDEIRNLLRAYQERLGLERPEEGDPFEQDEDGVWVQADGMEVDDDD